MKECKYEIKKNRMENLVNDDLEQSSSDESDNGSDNNKFNDKSSDYLIMDLTIINLLKDKTLL